MATPYRYFGKAMHMSAELKRVQHALRQKHPERYKDETLELTRMDREGKVSVTDRVSMKVMSPRRRHEFALRRPDPFHF